MIKFNRRQTTALASVFDNFATAAAVGVLVGTFVESKVSILNGVIMVAIAIIFIGLGIILRSGDD